MRISAGRFRGRRLPAVHDARPVGGRLKESLFSVLEPFLEGARVLDLCAGIGGFGLEALSRGAAELVMVEIDPRAVKALARWIEVAEVASEARVRRGDVRRKVPEGPFDIVFLDPPFVLWEGPEVGPLIGRAIEATAHEGLLILKIPEQMDLPEDDRWEVLRVTPVASAAYALLTPADPA